MRLTSGTRLGPYEIVAPLGAGGMGEVYSAKDTRLNRTVAIKILPSDVAADPEFRARFQREAKAVAALSHPHLCVLHDVGHQDGVDFLVMERLEGETLAERLQRGPLPFDQVLHRAGEIAGALEAAHRQGFIHRDLKPGNIMLTATGAKLLDFGLAKLRPGALGADGTTGSLAIQTQTAPITADHRVLGTLAYMAPEQLEGRDADPRSDIFAFGAILYEMTAGKRAFEAATATGVLAATLAGQPTGDSLDESIPLAFRKIVARCLARNPEQRWQSVGDLAEVLRWVEGEDPSKGATGSHHARWRLAWIGTIVAAFAIGAGVAGVSFRRSPVIGEPLRLSILAPAGTTFTPRDITNAPQFALSPDGERLAFVASAPGESPRLWLRSLTAGTAQALAGTEDASGPFWAPDSQSLAFFARRRLRKVSVVGGPPQDLADLAFDVTSGSWSANGVILFGTTGTGLYRISAEGGPAESVTKLDVGRQETGHRWPQFLPDGRHFIFYVRSTKPENSGVYLASIDSADKKQVLQSRASVVYAKPGHLLFEQREALAVQEFDADAAAVKGQPLMLGDRVRDLLGPGFLPVSVAENGTMAYWYGDRPASQLTWFDRSGRMLGALGSPDQYVNPVVSADGRKAIVTLRRGPNEDDVWSFDLPTGAFSRLTFLPGFGHFGVWSPNGQTVTFSGNVAGVPFLYQKAASGGEESRVFAPGGHYAVFPDDWSRDNRWLVYGTPRATGWDTWVLSLVDRKSKPILQSADNEVQARISPNGRWIAYASDESGFWNVYVQRFPEGSGRWQVSTGGGSQPLWRADGKELFYIATDGRLVAVPVGGTDTFVTGSAQVLFPTRSANVLAPFRTDYGVSPDGQRFLINNILPDAPPQTITIVVNWPAALGRAAP